jgi:hypothetical protein
VGWGSIPTYSIPFKICLNMQNQDWTVGQTRQFNELLCMYIDWTIWWWRHCEQQTSIPRAMSGRLRVAEPHITLSYKVSQTQCSQFLLIWINAPQSRLDSCGHIIYAGSLRTSCWYDMTTAWWRMRIPAMQRMWLKLNLPCVLLLLWQWRSHSIFS